MGTFANLSREERVGLGIAAVLHVGLVAALLWQVQDPPTPLPTPGRMEVSLADEVSLEATAPEPSAAPQAAIAPVLAPEPAPVVERVPEPVVRAAPVPRPTSRPVVRPAPQPTATRPVVRPTPTPRATAPSRPAPAPTARPSPRPTQATRGGGGRIGADFLDGTSAGERTETRGTPAATFGPAERSSLLQAISRQLRPHWASPQGVDAELLVTVVRFRLNRDGSLSGTPQILSQSGDNANNRAQKQRHAEQAIRAIRLAAPFDLPDEYYDQWKVIDSQFDRRL